LNNRARELVDSYSNWHHSFEIYPGIVTKGSYNPGELIEKLNLPHNLSGLRVLEIGPADGAFSLELMKRQAQLTIIDYRTKYEQGFYIMEAVNGLTFDYHSKNIYDLTAQSFGMFDIVLFLGVIYHLPDPVRALRILRSVVKERLYLETYVDTSLDVRTPLARYFPGKTLNNDSSNFWGFNALCLELMAQDAGFKVLRTNAWGDRVLLEMTPTEAIKHPNAYKRLSELE
jgi:tRNA (mo5U34)-methyltransferase